MISKFFRIFLFVVVCCGASHLCIGQASSPNVAKSTAAYTDVNVSSASFDAATEPALLAMKAKAEELKIGGAAVLAYFEGDKIESWSSKMLVVGRMKDEQTATDKGSNLLAIAYAKAAEMAETLKDSGNAGRPPMTGEFGWQGGVIVKVKTGYIIAAFSGGKSEDDVSVSRAGAAKMVEMVRK